VGSDMLPHIRRRFTGLLTNPVHADRVAAIVTRRKRAACDASSRRVHALNLGFIGGRHRGHWDSDHGLWLLPTIQSFTH
jgi:hypothetical protein